MYVKERLHKSHRKKWRVQRRKNISLIVLGRKEIFTNCLREGKIGENCFQVSSYFEWKKEREEWN